VVKINELKERYEKLNKENLRITLRLLSPLVIPTHFIHFDSILTDLIARKLFVHETDRWDKIEKHIDIPLPLNTYGKENKVWRASIAYINGLSSEYESMWNKRMFDKYAGNVVEDTVVWGAGVLGSKRVKTSNVRFEPNRVSVPPRNKGALRDFFEKRPVIQAESLVFFVDGNKEEIEKLLQNLHFIGKKRGIGYGQISSISVDVINEDYSLIDSEGYPSRVIPLSEAEGLNVPDNKRNIMLHSYKPAYYNPKNRVVCLTPRLNIPKLVVDSVDDEDEFDEEIYYG